jgi:hypothetical protein
VQQANVAAPGDGRTPLNRYNVAAQWGNGVLIGSILADGSGVM